ncbi:MAG: hypothetical protein AAB508_06055 [Patescibacteria group bacterium]
MSVSCAFPFAPVLPDALFSTGDGVSAFLKKTYRKATNKTMATSTIMEKNPGTRNVFFDFCGRIFSLTSLQ